MGHKWLEIQTRELIHLWKQYFVKLNSSKRNAQVYQEMSEKLITRLSLEKTTIDGKDVARKVENLKKQYRYETKKLRTEGGPSNWWAYNLVDDLLRGVSFNDDPSISGDSMSVDNDDESSETWHLEDELDNVSPQRSPANCGVSAPLSKRQRIESIVRPTINEASCSISIEQLPVEEGDSKPVMDKNLINIEKKKKKKLEVRPKRKKEKKEDDSYGVLIEMLNLSRKQFQIQDEQFERRQQMTEKRQESIEKLINVLSGIATVQTQLYEYLQTVDNE